MFKTYFLRLKGTSRFFMNKASIDRPVFFGILFRIFNLIAAPITGILIASIFTAKMQGYYYTFLSLLALQTLVELGLCIVIVQFAAHEWSHLRLNNAGYITGDSASISKLASLTRFTIKWYGIAALLVLIGLGVGGYYFFSMSPASDINWKLPWFSLCLLTSITILTLPINAVLEGCNQVSNLYAFFFYQLLFVKITLWTSIFLHTNLWALTFTNIISLLFFAIFILRKYRHFFDTLLFTFKIKEKLSWFREIWPMQWRIGLSCTCGYFLHYFFVPVLFKYHGAVVAGQMGLTWSAVGLIPSIANAWIAPKIPQYGMMIAQKNYNELDRLFWRLMKITILVSSSIALTAWFIVYMLNVFHHPFAMRLLTPLPLGILAFAQILQAVSLPVSGYLRAHKQEPLLFLSVSAGILTAVSNLTLGKWYSATGMAGGYLIVSLIIIPLIFLTWLKYKNKWHE
ncbi:MAG: hypothetical protein PHC29_07215 [Candidatus Omnitrophica bacterium]|nr:hypothetical protein [Candidatus Omnitrophota bacterium]